jgi:hypothetical protein
MGMTKTQSAKAKPVAPKAPAKSTAKPAAKAVAKPVAQAAAKTAAKAPARKKSSQETLLARVEAVRLIQRKEGHFDCFGRASSGFCDQGECAFHAECLSVSRMLHSV